MIEADELWSVVGGKRGVWWMWVALDADTWQVVGRVAGDRTEATARRLWAALPAEYRDGAVVCTGVSPSTGQSSRRPGTLRPGRRSG